MRSSTLAAAVAVLAIAALAPPASADTLKVGQGKPFQSIQAAVDMASDGDKILVFKGVYEENVVFPKDLDGVQLVGKKKPIWDGGPRDEAACLRATGNGITIQGFIFRNGQDCVVVDGNRTHVTKCTFRGNGEDHLDLEGDDIVIDKCRFRASNRRAIYVTGDDVFIDKNRLFGVLDEFDEERDAAITVIGIGSVIQRNTIKNVDHRGILVLAPVGGAMTSGPGTGAQILNNRITNVQNDAIRVGMGNDENEEVDDALIRGNRITSTDSDLIEVDGDRVVIEGNTLRHARDQIMDIDGDDAVIRFNKCSDVPDSEGISVEGHRAEVTDNVVLNTGEECIDVRGDMCKILRNVCSGSSSEDGILVEAFDDQGPANGGRVEDNLVRDCDESGIQLWMNGGTVSGNRVLDCGTACSNGVSLVVTGNGNEVIRNDVFGGTGTGVAVDGENNTLTDNLVVDCLLNGYFIEGGSGNRLTGCVARGCDAEGLDNQTGDTTVMGCTFLGNRIDVTNTGGSFTNAATFASDNEYETGGPDVEQEIGCENPYD